MPRGQQATAGFTLIEVLVAAFIVGFALMGITGATSSAVSAKAELEAEPFTATELAREIHELARTLPRAPSGVTGARSGSAVTALDSLVSSRFSPPIRADRSATTGRGTWMQEADLVVYDLDDLTTPTGESASAALSRHADRLYKLSVTVSQSGQTVQVFSWWITP